MGLLGRVPRPVQVVAVVTWLGLAVLARWQHVSGHDVPVAIWVILGAGPAVYAVLGVIRFLRSSNASDRPPFALSQAWLMFFAVTGRCWRCR